MKCHCDGPDNGHEFTLITDDGRTKTYRCPKCNRQITDTVSPVEESPLTLALAAVVESGLS